MQAPHSAETSLPTYQIAVQHDAAWPHSTETTTTQSEETPYLTSVELEERTGFEDRREWSFTRYSAKHWQHRPQIHFCLYVNYFNTLFRFTPVQLLQLIFTYGMLHLLGEFH